MNNSNALAEIQSKYPNCNLLLPAATSVQINPFYKCSVMEVVADTAPSSGDIFSVGKVKTGEDGKGKAIYEEVFSPAKPLLMKLATAAGIQFHPEYTTAIRENTNTYVGKAYGAVRLPDGSYKTHMETKRICLDDEESKYRLEFMDKSIMGIHDWRASKAAAEMFKGEWKQEAEPNQYGKYDKYYVIADSDREKYIERSILVNMTLLRKTASEKAQTGAILRVIRALLGIKGTYSKAELEKPFVVPTVTFAPDYTDPTVRNAMLQQGMNSITEFPRYRGKIYINIDDCGLGGGVTDRLEEVKQEEKLTRMVIVPVNAAGKVPEETLGDGKQKACDIYDNMTTYLWGTVKDALMMEEVSLENDNELVAQFTCRKYRLTSRGKMLLESKEEMKKRGIDSPDRADAVALSCYQKKTFNIGSLVD